MSPSDDEVYDLYEPVTEDEFFDFVDSLEDIMSEGMIRQFEDILGEECKFARKLWLRSQGMDIYLTVERK
ncbi:MAG: hypothetical protein Q4F58_02205 [Candidatus Saccharibacteria bacterium]|nr:hypothetical protein [Candidatus Saccharibacteria bacterium]